MRNLRLLVFVLLLIGTGVVFAQDETQERTVGALYGEHSGYTLSTPNGNPFVFLQNNIIVTVFGEPLMYHFALVI
ncbi:MAG: hypothetical protein AAF126_23030 [Chloroflexota bacterium]